MLRSDDALHKLSMSRDRFIMAILDDFLPTTIPAEIIDDGDDFLEVSFSFLDEKKKARDTDCIRNTVRFLNGKIIQSTRSTITAIF